MGLAGARKRQKISQDPNNTSWARSTAGFGHKILTSQGWTPGGVLGAQDAAQAEHYTDASKSHIRVAVKDDTLGIGARAGSGNVENFGLSSLADIYGRLNGRDSGQLQKEQDARVDLGRRLYVEQKFGAVKFVRGGYLVGDKIEDMKPLEDVPPRSMPKPPPVAASTTYDESDETTRRRLKKEKKERKARREQEGAIACDQDSTGTSEKTAKKRKRVRETDPSTKTAEGVEMGVSEMESAKDRHKRKAEQRKKKAEKELKRKMKEAAKESVEEKPSTEQSPRSGTSMSGSRQAVRQRYIQSKKMAGMNPQALREILMLKS